MYTPIRNKKPQLKPKVTPPFKNNHQNFLRGIRQPGDTSDMRNKLTSKSNEDMYKECSIEEHDELFER